MLPFVLSAVINLELEKTEAGGKIVVWVEILTNNIK